MLVLSRKVGEKILIGNDIALVVVEVKKGRIKLGIDAPSEFSIQRSELRDAAQKQAVAAQPPALVQSAPGKTWDRHINPRLQTVSAPTR